MRSYASLISIFVNTALVCGIAVEPRQGRAPACTSDACGNAFTRAPGMARSRQASSWCSTFMTASSSDSTITSTVTTTVPAGVVTVTASPAVTTTVTSQACPVPMKKREVAYTPTWAASVCTATGTVIPDQRLSSACSCMGITARTNDPTTTTQTMTENGPVTTTTVTPTVTSTIVNPWNPEPTNLLQNGGFEEQLSHWSYRLSDTWSHLQFATPGKDSNQTAQIDLQSPGGTYGPAYGNEVNLTQAIPPVHGSYDYRFSIDYQFLKYNHQIWSCDFTVVVGSTTINSNIIQGGPDDGWQTLVFGRQSSSQNPAYLSGPMTLSTSCWWDLNQAAGATMATIQLDNARWEAVAGCHPL